MKNKLMVDCETLDIGECPVLLSIGAVVFTESQIHESVSMIKQSLKHFEII